MMIIDEPPSPLTRSQTRSQTPTWTLRGHRTTRLQKNQCTRASLVSDALCSLWHLTAPSFTTGLPQDVAARVESLDSASTYGCSVMSSQGSARAPNTTKPSKRFDRVCVHVLIWELKHLDIMDIYRYQYISIYIHSILRY